MILFKKLANIYKSSAVVSFWTLLSRILGLIRDIIFAILLGAGPAADAFIIAFRLPSLFRRFFAEGTFSAAFIPLLAEHNKSLVVEKGLIFTSKITTIILFIILPLIIIAEIFMPNVVLLIAPGFADDVMRFELAVPYSRIVFPYLIFIIITSILAAALNTNGKFWAGAAAPVILNLIMILSMLIAFADSGDNDIGRIIYRHASNSLAFDANASERMRITSDGDLIVGGTALNAEAGLSIEPNASNGAAKLTFNTSHTE